MEDEPMTEFSETTPVEDLPKRLGFIESFELHELRSGVVEAMNLGAHNAIKEQLSNYQALAEEYVEQFQGNEFAKAQIGLIISTGLMWREAGNPVSYGLELLNARNYARNMRFDDLEEAIDAAYAAVEESVVESKESGYVGPPTEELLAVCKRELPIEVHEELDTLYALAPDEVLEEIAALMMGYDLGEPGGFFNRMGWTIAQETQSHSSPENT